MRQRALVASLVVAAIVWPALSAAQTWRTFDASRPDRDSAAYTVHVMYGAGDLSVKPAPAGRLYDVHLRYDAERADPVYRFNTAARSLEIGVNHTSVRKKLGGSDGSQLQILLSRSSPLRLSLDIGAADGDIDLSGLRLETLSLQTGATDTRMRFDAPNPSRLRTVDLQVGAASVQITGLGNANAERVDLNLGVGQAVLDFSGEWRGDADLSVASALGKIVIRVPVDVGVRVETSTFLHSLSADGMVKRDGHMTSTNWDTARHKLRIRSSGAFGQLEIQRTAR